MGHLDNWKAKQQAKYERAGALAWEAQQEALRRQEEARKGAENAVSVATRVRHLGGLTTIDLSQLGQLLASPEALTFSNMYGSESMTWAEVTAVLVDDHQEGRSRAGAVAAFGVLGLGARSTQTVTEITIHLDDGRIVAFAILDEPASAVRARFAPTLTSAGITLDRPPSDQSPTSGVKSFVDELERLAALYERGILSDDELAAAKGKLLGEGQADR